MRMRVLTTKLRVEIENENEMRVFLESLNFEIEMRVSQKSVVNHYEDGSRSHVGCGTFVKSSKRPRLEIRFYGREKFCCLLLLKAPF